METRLRALQQKDRSATAASPAHIAYAEMKDIPICMAAHLEVLRAPSVVLETIVGMWLPARMSCPMEALIWAACSSENILLMLMTYCLSISSASSSSPSKDLDVTVVNESRVGFDHHFLNTAAPGMASG